MIHDNDKASIPEIIYVERFVTIHILHTAENGYECRNESCICHQAEAERRAMEGDTGSLAHIEREQHGELPWR